MEDKKLQEENEKFWRNMREMEERSCASKRFGVFPCCKEICDKYDTPKCLHPKEAGFPAKRY